ncbi:thioredoxin TrxA [Thermovenabulum gondwanense]|uniref:Thioredoxin n=1 Tax=Thermovenabulum gondwanense TaxID=520767 RepID=A0A162M6V5_9FIRM|nr:thioredoxin domain-containing protein [Thermovenabulum gondwanense]KYO64344.1 Thioredoxin [Thermovenabulum gondwanense]
MIELNAENFEQEVLKAEGPVLVDFWGPKCEPCKALMPHVEELEKKYGDRVKFCKLDTSKNMRLAISQKVMGLPTLIIYKGGEKVDQVTKDVTVEMIEEMIKRNI